MEKFSYTARRGQYLSFGLVFVFLVTIEGGVIFLLSALLLPDGWRGPVELLAVGLHLFMLAYLFGPLLTAHYLTPTDLKLRYSFGFRVALPRTMLVAAEPVKEVLLNPMPVTARYAASKQEIRVAFSNQGQVWLYLDQPRRLRTGLFGGGPTRRILINLDDRDRFLAELNLPATPSVATPPALPVPA